jgi:hypothetical protein
MYTLREFAVGTYEPLGRLLKYVTEFRPNLLILIEPFLQAPHPLVRTLCESYDSFFENVVNIKFSCRKLCS